MRSSATARRTTVCSASRNHQAAIAIARMLVQLMLVGFALAFIFESDTPWIVLFVLAVMVTVSSWIALRTVASRRRHL